MLTLFNQEQVWNIERENIKKEAQLAMLVELVRDGSLSLSSAAKKANLDETMFKAKMAAL